MMVKDEAHTIARTLRSARPWIDRWCILDTGSTDGTPAIIERELDGVAGAVLTAPFEDFATTRNLLLGGAIKIGIFPTDFLLLLDADDVLEGGDALRAALEEESKFWRTTPASCTCLGGPCEGDGCAYDPAEWDRWEAECSARDAFYVRMRQGSTAWDSARVVRASAVGTNAWHYIGVVHEVLMSEGAPPPSIRIHGVTIVHDPPPASAERSRARWKRDLVLLAKELETNPTNTRAAFYYAKTLRQLGRGEEARAAFERRLALAGFWEERYDSAFERAKLLPTVEACVFGMLEAHAIDSRRAEPLAAAAWMLLTNTPQLFAPAYALAKRAWELPEPEGALFVDSGVYTWWAADLVAWSASHVGEWAIGERAARQALEAGPEHQRERLADNLAFYEKRRAT